MRAGVGPQRDCCRPFLSLVLATLLMLVHRRAGFLRATKPARSDPSPGRLISHHAAGSPTASLEIAHLLGFNAEWAGDPFRATLEIPQRNLHVPLIYVAIIRLAYRKKFVKCFSSFLAKYLKFLHTKHIYSILFPCCRRKTL